VAESNIHPDQEPKKRRTKRIIQAVPITVTGVDALGRPFQERTSTVTINCQGCRYQSIHYVLKNMWVTFEVPHNEPGRGPRSVRARVNWIQRPRTVRELFQIGVELEVSGNIWGIAFPPGDWFPFPESGVNLDVPTQPEPVSSEPENQDWEAAEAPLPRALELVGDNVRVLPISGSKDASLQLSQQVARLVSEAKEQIQSTARESANEAVAAIAAQIEETQHETLRHRQSEQEAALLALREEMARERSQQASEARQQIEAQLAEVERVRQADFELRIQNQLQAAMQKLESMTQALEASENEARVAIEQMRISSEQAATNELRLWQEQMDQRSADAQARLVEMDHAAKSLREQIAVIGDAQSQVAAEAESVVAGMAERFQSALEATGRKTVDELVGELQQRLSPQMASVEEATGKLMFDREQAEKTLAEHQERVWQASDRNLQDTVTRGKELLAQIETEFGESAREAISRWISELEAKATETTQGTFEALFKSADWYEKKVQNQMQTTLQKGVDQAAAQLREKAAELSGMFAQELDHGSRSYVDHAKRQIQESATEAAERASQQIAEGGDAAAAQFHERAGQVGQQQFEAYASKTQAAFEQNAVYMEDNATQVRAKLESDARGFAVEFQRALSQHVQQTLAQGIQELASQIDQAREDLLSESQALQRQFGASFEPLGIAAIDEHKKRLDNASNAWLLTTVTKLNQQSESLIAELADTTEKKLKAVCSAVISEMGTTLRQRLGGLAAPPSAVNPPEEKK
jgi:hypothetical protein